MLNTAVRHFSIHARVAVVGGGAGGVGVSSQLANSGVFRPEDITVIDGNNTHYYQPGLTNTAGGVWSHSMIQRWLRRDMKSVLSPSVNWHKSNVASFDPSNNSLTCKDGETITYDYLVVGTGLQLRYDFIPGATEALDDETCPVGSMYRYDYAMKMRQLRENFKGGKAVFTLPQMPIKCGGAPQKILYLSEHTFRTNKVRENCDVHYYTSTPAMFPVAKYCAEQEKLIE